VVSKLNWNNVIGKGMKIWHDPVWSKVIAAGILAAIAWTGTHFNWWSFFLAFLSASTLPNWAVIVLLVLLVLLAIRFILSVKSRKVTNATSAALTPGVRLMSRKRAESTILGRQGRSR
jgi:hypothetical protein